MDTYKNYYLLYEFFNSPVAKLGRILSFFAVGVVVYIFRENTGLLIFLFEIYGILIVQEFFISKKLNTLKPIQEITTDSNDPSLFLTPRLVMLSRGANVNDLISKLLKEEEVVYLNRLLGLKNVDTNSINIDEPFLFGKTLELVKRIGGKYINGVDVYVAYLFLLDEKNQLLFNNGIFEEDLLTILSWTRKEFEIDQKKKHEIKFTGSGAFDFFVYGWSGELARYASNLTLEVLPERIVNIGREKEYELLLTALSRSNSSNAIIIGDAGVGKTTLVKKFTIDSNQGILPAPVSNKLVFKLFPEKLLSGVNNQGELEERLTLLLDELVHAGNIVLYIPNIENIFGGGGINLDASGILMNYLTGSRIKVIGSINEGAYQNFIYPKQELKQLFDIVKLDELSLDKVTHIVMEKAKEIASANRISIEYMAIKEICKLSSSYLNDGTAMPGRAIKLLDDVVAFCKTHNISSISRVEVRNLVESKVNIVLDKPSSEESQALLNLESEIHKRIVSQDEAVQAISDAMRRVRSGMKNEKRPIASFLFLGPTGVGKTETAKALAATYFGNEEAMIRLDMSEYQRQESIERFLGASQNENFEETVLDKVLNKPFSLILMDEFEKAHPQVIDLFLQVFDEGRLTDNRGRTVSFKDSIIIATSNAGSEFIREKYKEGIKVGDFKQELVDLILSKNIFKPELVNRFDDVIVFKPLTQNDIINVAKLFLESIAYDLHQKQIEISYDETVPKFIAERSYSVEFGGRNVRRFIEQTLENKLSKKILENPGGEVKHFNVEIVNDEMIVE